MSIREAIQRVQSLYSKGAQSWSSRLRARHIYSKLKSASAFVMRREYLRRRFDVSEWSYVTIPCIEMMLAPVHECPCIPANGCVINRSKHKIPKPIEISGKIFLRSVMSLDGNIAFSRTSFHTAKYLMSNPALAYSNHYYIHNDYIYTIGPNKLKVLTIDMLPEDPFDAYAFPGPCKNNNKGGSECEDYLDRDLPVLDAFVEEVIERATEELIQLFSQMPEDSIPNNKDQ